MLEIRIHGRGGQGAKTIAEILASTTIKQGREAKTFPEFGPERTGAPIENYLKISENSKEEIKSNQPIINPDIIVILDKTLLENKKILAGLKKKGFLVINTSFSSQELRKSLLKKIKNNFKIATLDASSISFSLFEKNLPNIVILGGLMKILKFLKPEKIEEEIKEKFSHFPKEIIDKNIEAFKRGIAMIKIEEYEKK